MDSCSGFEETDFGITATGGRRDEAQRSGMKFAVFQGSVAWTAWTHWPRCGCFLLPKPLHQKEFSTADMNDDSNQTLGAGNEIFQHWACLRDHNNPITGGSHITVLSHISKLQKSDYEWIMMVM